MVVGKASEGGECTMRKLKLEDSEIGPLLLAMEAGVKPDLSTVQSYTIEGRRLFQLWDQLYVHKDILWRRFENKDGRECIAQLVVPRVARENILSEIHSSLTSAHLGEQKTLSRPVAAVEELKPYVARKLELTLQDDCVLWGTQVVIPKKLQAAILEEIHKDHAGIRRIKALARSYVWWPGLDREVEQLVKSCLPCQSVRNAPSVAPLHPWVWPAQPWQRIHVDFAGPVEKCMLMVVVDAHSKWPEVIEMTSTTSELTIQAMRGLFAVHGLPDQVVSDNGPQIMLKEFQRFMKENGIKHTRCVSYHPSLNGLAERFVQILKNALRRTKDIGRTFQHRLAGFLLAYRTTLHAATNVAPCELLMNRKIRTRLDLLYPDVESRVAKNVSRQTAMHDVHAKAREFLVGQLVRVCNLRDGPKWVPRVVVGRQGPLSYVVQTTGGEVWKCHVDQI